MLASPHSPGPSSGLYHVPGVGWVTTLSLKLMPGTREALDMNLLALTTLQGLLLLGIQVDRG